MTDYINTEQMERAAITFDNSVDHLARVANQFENVAHQMSQTIDRLEQLSIAIQNIPCRHDFVGSVVGGLSMFTCRFCGEVK